MKSNKLHPKKNKAQAMVEFAIALPILLMLLYGILEAGRLLFLYSTIVTASRQAVRYGSTTGVGTGGVPRYQDCAGIRATAQRADFLNAFDDTDILIQYDSGPGTTKTTYCAGSPLPSTDASFHPSTANTNRLVVTIDGDFFPIVPKLVPFIERSVSKGNPIKGISARTVLVSIAIQVTAPPLTWLASTPTFTFTPTDTPSPTPTRTPTNTPSPTPLFTSTPSQTPTKTLIPTKTSTPTNTSVPAKTVTVGPTTSPVACNITHGPLNIAGSTMTMTITNSTGTQVQIQDIFVQWNHDKGHATGTDKTLQLNSVTLGIQIWSGTSSGPSLTITPSPTAFIPTGTSTIVFTFDKSYDNLDGRERIVIYLATPGCTPYPIDSSTP